MNKTSFYEFSGMLNPFLI